MSTWRASTVIQFVPISYSATSLTVATQQTFLQVSSHNIIICLTGMPPCKVEHNQMETYHIVFINKSYTVPCKCKLTVSIESRYSTRSSILSSIELRVSSSDYRGSSSDYRGSSIANRRSSIANRVLSIEDRGSSILPPSCLERTRLCRGSMEDISHAAHSSLSSGCLTVRNKL